MDINLIYDPSTGAAPAGFAADVAAAAQYLDMTLTDDITVNIDVGWQEIGGVPLRGGEQAEGGPAAGELLSYSQVRSELAAHATSAADLTAFANLPAADPTAGGNFYISPAQEKAWGLMPANGTKVDGDIGFGPNAKYNFDPVNRAIPGEYDFFDIAVHQLCFALGRISGLQVSGLNQYTVLDLFRYASSGQRELVSGQTAYFSIDGGATNLNYYDLSSDDQDWAATAAPDAFDAAAWPQGVELPFSQSDMTEMNVIGFQVGPAPTATNISFTPSAGPLGLGAAFSIALSFNETVSVSGAPTLTLSDGGVATYSGGTGGSTLIFSGSVSASDSAVSRLAATSLNFADGTVTGASGNLPATGLSNLAQSGPAIDPTQSNVEAISFSPPSGDLGVGKPVTISLSLTQPVAASGAPFLTLNDGGVAAYQGGSGGSTLTFITYVASGASSVGSLAVSGLIANGGAIVDNAGNPFVFSSAGVAQSGPRIDATPPIVSAIAILPASGAVSVGGSVMVTVAATKTLTVTGTPTLALNDGGSATYIGGNGSSQLEFLATVGSTASSVGALAATSIDLASGTIADAAGNALASTLPQLSQSGPAVLVGATSVAGASGSPPDVSGGLSAQSAAFLAAAIGSIEGSRVGAAVVDTATGATTVPPVAGAANVLVAASAAAGGVVMAPSGFAAVYLLSAGAAASDANGSLLLVAAGQDDTLFGAANDTLIGGNAATELIGGAGAETLVGGTGPNTILLGAGAADVYSQGADTIVGGSGGETVAALGAPLMFGGAGALQFNDSGVSATLVGGGAETVNANAGNLLVFAGSNGALDFNAGGGSSTVVSYAGGGTLNGGDAPTLYFGIGPTTYNAGAAVDTVVGYGGGMTATGGANGTLFFTGSAGGNVISTGTGAATIIGFGAEDVYNATGSADDVIEAAGASQTIDASQSAGSNSLFAYAANDVVIGGSGGNAIQSAFGNQTLIAGAGTTLFQILNSGSNRAITIENFNAAQDFVQFENYPSGISASALRSETTAGGSEILTLDDGTRVTFSGASGLTGSSFV